MGSKVLVIEYRSPLMLSSATIRSTLFVDEGKGERAITKLQNAIDKMYADELFTKGRYVVYKITTVWEEGVSPL